MRPCSFTKKETVNGTPIISVLVPLGNDASDASGVNYTTKYTGSTPELVAQVQGAIAKGKTVDIDVETDLRGSEAAWDAFEDFLTKATAQSPSGKIVLCEIVQTFIFDYHSTSHCSQHPPSPR
jgi:hypothetical protein